jgi:hypothetical protein
MELFCFFKNSKQAYIIERVPKKCPKTRDIKKEKIIRISHTKAGCICPKCTLEIPKRTISSTGKV